MKQLSMVATSWVIWLCSCVRYWPYHGVVLCAPRSLNSVLDIGVLLTTDKKTLVFTFMACRDDITTREKRNILGFLITAQDVPDVNVIVA